ncbi:MAG: hypothetical protein KDD62_13945, partial [Bdellovibrionales bacterium]|nr:hypothetical protein [Bdellovibrionales bacterium]
MSEKKTNELCGRIKNRIEASGQDRNDLLRAHLSGLILLECSDNTDKAYIQFANDVLEVSSAEDAE